MTTQTIPTLKKLGKAELEKKMWTKLEKGSVSLLNTTSFIVGLRHCSTRRSLISAFLGPHSPKPISLRSFQLDHMYDLIS